MAYYYKVLVHTGDESGAGTDSDIFIKLFGERNISNEICLNNLNSDNCFEKNDTNVFVVTSDVDLGEIYQIAIRSDYSRDYAGWLLDYVQVGMAGNNPVHAFLGELNMVRFIMPSGTWIEDRNTRYYTATSGYTGGIPQRKEIQTMIEGALVYVPAGAAHTDSYSTKTTCTIDTKRVETTDVQTGASVGASYEAISATISAQVEDSISQEVGEHYGKEITVSHEVKFPVVNEDRVYRVMWSEMSYQYSMILGKTQYDFVVPFERDFSGIKVVNK